MKIKANTNIKQLCIDTFRSLLDGMQFGYEQHEIVISLELNGVHVDAHVVTIELPPIDVNYLYKI